MQQDLPLSRWQRSARCGKMEQYELRIVTGSALRRGPVAEAAGHV